MAQTSTHITTKTNGIKRKREDTRPSKEDGPTRTAKKRNSTKDSHEGTDTSEQDETPSIKPLKTKLPKSSKSQTTTEPPPSISSLPPSLLSQKFTQTNKKYKSDLSPIELEDLSLPPTSFLDTTTFSSTRDPSDLSLFLSTFTPGGTTTLKATPSSPSTPHTLVLTTSAIRTTHLLRGVRDLGTPESKIAKLFAKHMKLAVMEDYVRKTTFGIAAGTPGRVLDLIKGESLKLEGLKRVVLDGTYVDEKGRGIWGDKECFERVLEFVNLDGVKGRLVKGDVQVLVF